MIHLQREISFVISLVLLVGCTSPGTGTPGVTENPPTSAPPVPVPTTPVPIVEPPQIPPNRVVDVSSLTGKLLMGYQGWFTCPGDGTNISNGYYHWIRDGYSRITTESFAVDMWPDTSELSDMEKCPTDLTYPDGSPAYLYSAANPQTVLRHFEWMYEYGIDGVFLQRFGSQIIYPEILDQRTIVTRNVETAAETYGRGWAIMYDVTGINEKNVDFVETFEADWKYLVDVLKVTESSAYLHHNGLPVLAIWGLGFRDRSGTPEEAAQLVDFFKNNPDPKYRVTLLGGVPFWWRTLQDPSSTDPAWAEYYCSLDIISPWSVGAFETDGDADYYKSIMREDMRRTKECDAEYMPVVYPGYAYHWANPDNPFNQIPRRGGRLYWRQVFNAISVDATMLYNAMFDEVDEATAMYKIAARASDAPTGLQVINMDTDGECLPGDWYLRLAGEANKMLKGEIPLTNTIPIAPEANPACQTATRMRFQISTTSDWTTLKVEGVEFNDVLILSSSPEASEAVFDQNQLVLTQPIQQAEAGQAVEMVVDLYPAGFAGSTFTITIGRGDIGGTNVEVYAVSDSDLNVVETFEWSGITGDGQNLTSFEIPSVLFGAP
jgi:hypothetical protein